MMGDPAVMAYVEMTEMLRIGTLNSEYVHQNVWTIFIGNTPIEWHY